MKTTAVASRWRARYGDAQAFAGRDSEQLAQVPCDGLDDRIGRDYRDYRMHGLSRVLMFGGRAFGIIPKKVATILPLILSVGIRGPVVT